MMVSNDEQILKVETTSHYCVDLIKMADWNGQPSHIAHFYWQIGSDPDSSSKIHVFSGLRCPSCDITFDPS